MKIVKPTNTNDKEFNQVVPSQVVEYDGKVFMKVEQFNSHMTNYNAINLTTSKFTYIGTACIVRVHPHAEVHLK